MGCPTFACSLLMTVLQHKIVTDRQSHSVFAYSSTYLEESITPKLILSIMVYGFVLYFCVCLENINMSKH